MRRFSILLSFGTALTLAPACSGDHLGTKGQMIECKVAADGSTSGCQPVSAPSGAAGTCVDIDEDGDDDPADADESDKRTTANATGDADDDGDGLPDSTDTDDDNDGVGDADDCDELPGGDSDDAAE